MSELIIFSGKLKGRRLVLPEQRDIVVGRDEDCHMRIASSLVSRKHCILKAGIDGILVRDLQSQNGTYVNEVAITEPFVMKPGDQLRVGAAVFQVPRTRNNPTSDDSGGRLSDDDITSWLTDHDQTLPPAAPDTTVIKGRQPPSSSAHLATQPTTEKSSPERTATATASNVVATVRQPPRSIKEQAAEIIKRHWEMMREKQ